MESQTWLRKQVCAYFNISRATLYRWIKTRGFPEPEHYRADRKDPGRYPIVKCLAWHEANVHRSTRLPQSPSTSEGVTLDAE